MVASGLSLKRSLFQPSQLSNFLYSKQRSDYGNNKYLRHPIIITRTRYYITRTRYYARIYKIQKILEIITCTASVWSPNEYESISVFLSVKRNLLLDSYRSISFSATVIICIILMVLTFRHDILSSHLPHNYLLSFFFNFRIQLLTLMGTDLP